MASVKPISATMPSTTEPSTAHSTPRGTLRRGSTASSDMSAASSNPTRVNAPSRPARVKAYHVGLWNTEVVLVRMPAPYCSGLDLPPPQHQQHAEHDGSDDLGEHRDVVDPRSPASMPAVKPSPQPVVSTTSTLIAGSASGAPPPRQARRQPSAPRVTATPPTPSASTSPMAAVRSSRPVSARSWSSFGRNQSAARTTSEIRSRSRGLPGCNTSTATIAPAALAAQTARVHAVPGHRGGDHVADQVVADRADRVHLGAKLGEIDARPGRRARGGGPDLGEPGAALAGRYRLDRPAEHVEYVRPEHGDLAKQPGSRGAARFARHGLFLGVRAVR
jgi:hypothetical protein